MTSTPASSAQGRYQPLSPWARNCSSRSSDGRPPSSSSCGPCSGCSAPSQARACSASPEAGNPLSGSDGRHLHRQRLGQQLKHRPALLGQGGRQRVVIAAGQEEAFDRFGDRPRPDDQPGSAACRNTGVQAACSRKLAGGSAPAPDAGRPAGVLQQRKVCAPAAADAAQRCRRPWDHSRQQHRPAQQRLGWLQQERPEESEHLGEQLPKEWASAVGNQTTCSSGESS